MKKSFILFDFDGVIADTFQPAFAVNKMICPRITEDGYRKRLDGNINDWKDQDPISVHTEECRHDIDFSTEYAPRMKNEARIIPEIKEVIAELEKNHVLIVISSTVTGLILEFLEEHGLANYFVEILGNDVHKSKVEKIKMVFGKHGIGADDCVFVTDTLGDIREATCMSVGAIGVTWGFQAPETLLQGKPFRLVEKPSDLLNAVADYFNLNRASAFEEKYKK